MDRICRLGLESTLKKKDIVCAVARGYERNGVFREWQRAECEWTLGM